MQGSNTGDNEVVRIAQQVAGHTAAIEKRKDAERKARRDRDPIPQLN